MSNGDTPNPTQPWWLDGKTVTVLVGMLLGFGLNAMQGCQTHNKVDTVQQHQAINSAKIDDAKVAAEQAKDVAKENSAKVETKLDSVEKKADSIKAAVSK